MCNDDDRARPTKQKFRLWFYLLLGKEFVVNFSPIRIFLNFSQDLLKGRVWLQWKLASNRSSMTNKDLDKFYLSYLYGILSVGMFECQGHILIERLRNDVDEKSTE